MAGQVAGARTFLLRYVRPRGYYEVGGSLDDVSATPICSLIERALTDVRGTAPMSVRVFVTTTRAHGAAMVREAHCGDAPGSELVMYASEWWSLDPVPEKVHSVCDLTTQGYLSFAYSEGSRVYPNAAIFLTPDSVAEIVERNSEGLGEDTVIGIFMAVTPAGDDIGVYRDSRLATKEEGIMGFDAIIAAMRATEDPACVCRKPQFITSTRRIVPAGATRILIDMTDRLTADMEGVDRSVRLPSTIIREAIGSAVYFDIIAPLEEVPSRISFVLRSTRPSYMGIPLHMDVASRTAVVPLTHVSGGGSMYIYNRDGVSFEVERRLGYQTIHSWCVPHRVAPHTSGVRYTLYAQASPIDTEECPVHGHLIKDTESSSEDTAVGHQEKEEEEEEEEKIIHFVDSSTTDKGSDPVSTDAASAGSGPARGVVDFSKPHDLSSSP